MRLVFQLKGPIGRDHGGIIVVLLRAHFSSLDIHVELDFSVLSRDARIAAGKI